MSSADALDTEARRHIGRSSGHTGAVGRGSETLGGRDVSIGYVPAAGSGAASDVTRAA